MNSYALYFSQLRGMLVRNLLLKKRDMSKTIMEAILPLYFFGILILVKVLTPNPNFPAITTQRHQEDIFELFNGYNNNTIAVVANSTETLSFLNSMNSFWLSMGNYSNKHLLNFMVFDTKDELQAEYWKNPYSIPLAVIFEHPQPISQHLKYEIRMNPSYTSPPSSKELYSTPSSCRQSLIGEACPVNNYLHSGFLALQMIMDMTKIRLDTGNSDVTVPDIKLIMFPKEAYTAGWMVAFRVVVPLFMVLALSQFVTYLLILIVSEKEKKIKEGMRTMGLNDSVFWLSWFIIYSVIVFLFSAVGVTLLFALKIFQYTHFLPVFLLMVLYSFSMIMFAFMITPFFDKARTAGVIGNFAVTILSLIYFIQVFLSDSSASSTYWLISLISPTALGLAMDKVVVLDLQGEGLNFDNLWSGSGIPFGGSLIMITLDIFLYGFLAYYLDSVIPSEHGTKRPPWFCFLPGFWCQKEAQSISSSNSKSDSFIPDEETNPDVEPVVREMKDREAIRIADLHKSFHKCRRPEIKAVNGINLTIYESQITAILGHNGAGKTTLFNILTGLIAPTSGTALIFGYDVRDSNDMRAIRSMTGVCPQHDILFDLLTPREHLEFFAAVRGIPRSMIQPEVEKTLKDIDLVEKADTFAQHLSGGQKRKLSVGIAIIGDPKIIILDEPTSGVDPYSKRQLWSLLQSRRHGKVILMTTHAMEEADILADRKAVISKGKLRCCGSSLFLKNKFGIGYHLTLVLEGNAKEGAIGELVMSYVSRAEKVRRHGHQELSFILPYNSVENFAPLFSAIEHEIETRSSNLGISSYGVSMTTLEEVFLQLEKEEEEPKCEMDLRMVFDRLLSLQPENTYQSLQNEAVTNQGDSRGEANDLPDGIHNDGNPPVLGLGLDSINIRPSFSQSLYAILRIRVLRLFRNVQLLCFTIIMPLALTAIGLYVNSTQKVDVKMEPLQLNNCTYDETKILYRNNTNHDITKLIDSITQDVEHIEEYDGNFTNLLNIAPHIAAFNVNDYNLPQLKLAVTYNDTMQHSLPILINILSNAYYRLIAKENKATPIEVYTYPFQQISQQFNNPAGYVTLLGMVFTLLPISLAVDMVYDREIKAKSQLRVNGVSFSMYFLSYFIVLLGLIIFICLCIFGIMFLFDVPSLQQTPAIISLAILIMLYCLSSVFFTACVSYMFNKLETAQSMLPYIAILFGLLPFIIIMVLDMQGGTASFALHVFFSLSSSMYMPFATIYYVDRIYLTCSINTVCHYLTMSDYLTTEIIILASGALLQCPIWLFVLFLLDINKSGGNVSDVLKHYFLRDGGSVRKEIVENSDVGEHEDADVKRERQKVFDCVASPIIGQEPPLVLLQNLRKEYRQKELGASCYSKREREPKIAVRNLSLAVEQGEILGLLGHNGAGKTTTMKIIITEVAPTKGRVQINGYDINTHMTEAFQQMSYCPQYDAHWKNITIREHLQCYAAIRGVPGNEINRIVDRYLSELQIHEHANKQSQECSGGTRRKLSFAMAMVGEPKVILMDEPSTGMDPKSKRFLWDTIITNFQGDRGVILTTHSMEEADALCSRVAIMVNGELRCIGSTQHLKNVYGAGYTLEIKLGGDCTPTSSNDRIASLKAFVANLFPDAILEESFADRLVFAVPQHAVKSLAECFTQFEKAKLEMDIEEYSFSQITLEQVFLKFSH
ncbi:PREDICTED: ABC transporter A family member 1-like isoform X2 [Vollenhovia emeryi]|nr:PREDICTED: ABC transporter A family member 1-like isoform X2 [Vollenhovia emeryi]XP_011864543.1 PREDICTED: ABC transporter A family member 1-like isoform X2 [Vollenhovia emeryi]